MGYNVAIDGPAGAGKSTVAKLLAKKLNLNYLDTGAMYRAVALLAIKKGIKDEKEIIEETKKSFIKVWDDKVYLNNIDVTKDIKSLVVTKRVSDIAKIPEIRALMLELQQEIAKNKDVVMDGRDTGTTVLPDAEYKFFLTADIEVRAKRRYAEMIQKGQEVKFEEVLEDIAKRDKQDTERSCSPLIKADDAIVIDTTYKSIEEVVHELIDYIKREEK